MQLKAEAVKQVSVRGHGAVEVANWLGIANKGRYLWVRLAKEKPGLASAENASLRAWVSRLKAEFKRCNFVCLACAKCGGSNAEVLALGRQTKV